MVRDIKRLIARSYSPPGFYNENFGYFCTRSVESACFKQWFLMQSGRFWSAGLIPGAGSFYISDAIMFSGGGLTHLMVP
jgi:hypothetical protein